MVLDGSGRAAQVQFAVGLDVVRDADDPTKIKTKNALQVVGSGGPFHQDLGMRWNYPSTGGAVGFSRVNPTGPEESYEAMAAGWYGNDRKGPYLALAGDFTRQKPKAGETYDSGMFGGQLGWHIPVDIKGKDLRVTPFAQGHEYINRFGDNENAFKFEGGVNLYMDKLPLNTRLNLAPKVQVLESEGHVHVTPVLSLFIDGVFLDSTVKN
jgi:hypothetical protein